MSTNSLINGIKLHGSPALIPDSKRKEFPFFCKEMGYNVGVEIGVAEGKFTEVFAKAGLKKIYGIDPWQPYPERMEQESHDSIYQRTIHRLSRYPNVEIIKKTSMDAVESFKDKELDFVYIDGNHDFGHVASDIYEWGKKVRTGGVIAGHDYWTFLSLHIHCSVIVDAYVRLYKIRRWYLFGEERQARMRSWMIIKNW